MRRSAYAAEAAGLACVVAGVWLVHEPAALITAGVALVAIAQGWERR